MEISEPSTLCSDAGDGPTVPDVSEISSIEITLAHGTRIAVTGRLDSGTLCGLLRVLGGL